ncbi:DNA-processing protein DprA [uncultured Granulicatella sp.]|uniref:DNA-processing protein DprA n=1 Tax=uncultured Granulicatella sp. TaxID=316089 RepID=UPI0028D759EA|nr:DNA-processing protein DprA [uncultured Granulicatella sp.]
MEWTRRTLMIALAMRDKGSSQQRWELYQRLCQNEWTEGTFTLEAIHQELSLEEIAWLRNTDFANLELQYRKEAIHFLMYEDALYPKRLKEIYLPPVVLFYKGRLELFNRLSIGIVGARNHTPYSKEALEYLLPDILERKVSIISGLARGVDSLAHQLTLDLKGETIAVIGNGINICYPKENQSLYDAIGKKGLILSEYPLDSPPLKFHFPYRNRIIAGLSHGLCVIEAKMHSGSLITANVALSENRQVFALPGNITSEYSKGTNELITAGAFPIRNANDILDSLHYFP